MSRNKMRPLPTEPSTHKSAKSRRTMWLVLIAVLVVIAIGYWFSQQSSTEALAPINRSSSLMTEQTEMAKSASAPTDNLPNELQSNDATLDNNQQPNNTTIDIADPKAILNAPLPESDSLAKEEIDRLKDEEQRMAEQDKLAAEQLAMNKQLSDMKTEQIALFEQQIAQLKSGKVAKSNNK